jgi:hypothetical protein
MWLNLPILTLKMFKVKCHETILMGPGDDEPIPAVLDDEKRKREVSEDMENL